MKNKQRLINEVEYMLSLSDNESDAFLKRIDFIRLGRPEKARFIDEHVLPNLKKKVLYQAEKVLAILNEK